MGILSLIILLGNYAAGNVTPLDALPGMIVLWGIAALGLLLFEVAGIKGLPLILYISLLGVAATAPFSPFGPLLASLVEKVSFLSLATPVLACAGLGLAKEADSLKAQGGRMLIVSFFVFTGTFIGSAVIAEVLLRLLGLAAF